MLRETFPDFTARERLAEWEYGYRAGQQSIIDFLEDRLRYDQDGDG